MTNTKLFTTTALLATAALGACAGDRGYDDVHVDGAADVVVARGLDASEFEMDCDSDDADVKVDDGRLEIDAADGTCVVFVHPRIRTLQTRGDEPVVLVPIEDLRLDRIEARGVTIEGSDGGSARIGEIVTDHLEVDLSGDTHLGIDHLVADDTWFSTSGQAEILVRDLDTGRWSVRQRGGSSIESHGYATRAMLDLRGNATLDASDTIVEQLDAEIGGNAAGAITVTGAADTTTFGNATLEVLRP